MNKNSPISKHVINGQRVRILYRHEIQNESGYEVGIDDAFTNKSYGQQIIQLIRRI